MPYRNPKFIALGAALALTMLLPALPAQAQTLDELDCALREAREGLGRDLVDQYLFDSGYGPEGAPYEDDLFGLMGLCITQLGIAEENFDPFIAYSIARLMAEEMRGRIARLGVRMVVIENALDARWDSETFSMPESLDAGKDRLEAEIARAGQGDYAITLVGSYLGFVHAGREGLAQLRD